MIREDSIFSGFWLYGLFFVVNYDSNIQAHETVSNTTIKVFDVAGRVVATDSMGANTTQKTLYLDELDAGIYFIQIGENENRSLHKISKI